MEPHKSKQAHADLPATGDGIDTYLRAILAVQERVVRSQQALLTRIAERMEQAVLEKKRIFVFGTGHSHMLAEEAFCRAGGLAAVVPIFYSALMLHESIPVEALLERTPGIAPPLLDGHKPQPGEMIFIFSNSGVNHVPVEMAMTARERGLTVVTISSIAFSKTAPLSALGKRLADLADFAVDNGGVPGDAMVRLGDELVGPSSTIVGCTIINALVTETARRLHARQGEAPILVSQNMPGGLEHNIAMAGRWDVKGTT
jgi:uncharacterized phosphosugar-binding protein